MPATKLFWVRSILLRLAGAEVGSNVKIVSSARFYLGGPLSIRENTWIGHEVLVVGGNAEVLIAENCDIAPRVMLVTGSHVVEPLGPRAAGATFSSPIKIGAGCWVCAGATILGGTTIGEHSVIAAGAVVKGEFPSYSIIGGVPARVLRLLSEDSPERAVER